MNIHRLALTSTLLLGLTALLGNAYLVITGAPCPLTGISF